MGCRHCNVAYSFVFNCQFHAKDCPVVSPVKPHYSTLAREILATRNDPEWRLPNG